MVHERFEIAGGSVAGRSHVAAGRCNQDAYAWGARGDAFVAVVCDGCGSGAHSEIGARIGARIVVERALRELSGGGSAGDAELWDRVRAGLLADLAHLAGAMGGDRAEVVSDHLLFTVVGLAVAGGEACVFAAGDGLYAVGGAVETLGPFPRNEPPYLAYGLLDGAACGERSPRLGICKRLAAADLDTALIGTDGAVDLLDLAQRRLPGDEDEVGPIARFWEGDRFFQNRDAVRRQLARCNREVSRPIWAERRVAREAGLLEDDTTIVVVRRRRSGR
jgi:Protein phosphatase 2C